jgi:hypothetical protein
MKRGLRSCQAAAVAAAVSLAAQAAELQPLADAELASVRGSDGLAFNLIGFSLSGPLALTYGAPDGASLKLSNLALSRSDDPAATYSDPYTLRVLARGNGLADVIRLAEPQNAAGLLKWQFAADWSVAAGGIDFQGGALVVDDLVSRGGSLTLTTVARPGVEGIAFGLGLRADIGQLSLRPRGRGDASEQFAFSGVRLGAASEDGTWLGAPWHIADATNQPGVINALTEGGMSTLHVGIDWPAGAAPIGALAIDNVGFRSASLPGGVLDLGSSRIGTIQIQFLDAKLRPGP